MLFTLLNVISWLCVDAESVVSIQAYEGFARSTDEVAEDDWVASHIYQKTLPSSLRRPDESFLRLIRQQEFESLHYLMQEMLHARDEGIPVAEYELNRLASRLAELETE